MISITLTGNTIDEVGGQALALVMKLAGAQPAVVQPPAADQAVEEAPPTVEVVNVRPQTIEVAPPRKRRTRAEIDAANAAAQKASTIGAVNVQPETVGPQQGAELHRGYSDGSAPETVEPTPIEIVEALAAPMFDDLKRALQEVCETNGAGVDAAKMLMADFATPPRLSLIKEERWPEFIERARAVVAGARK